MYKRQRINFPGRTPVATGVLPGKLIRGKQTCGVKTEKERVPFIDRTFRLMSVKALKLLWNYRKSPFKTTVVSDD